MSNKKNSTDSSEHLLDVTRFFDGYANNFHEIYGRQHSRSFEGIVDRLTRKGMFARFEEVFRLCYSTNAKSLIDVGCGPGTHDIILTEQLGIEIYGIDISSNMIAIAEKNSTDHSVSDKCTYSVADFMDFETDRKFDISIALGVIEYIENPSSFIKKMIKHANKYTIFSLPVKWHILTPQRIIRYKIRKCPLIFYSIKNISKLMTQCNASSYDIKRLYRDYLIIIHNAEH